MERRVQLGVDLCILLFLVVVLLIALPVYYFKWQKRRIAGLDQEAGVQNEEEKEEIKHSVKILHFLWRWKKVDVSVADDSLESSSPVNEEDDVELGSSNRKTSVEESVDVELMRLHNLCGPPRFLFTITEESEELESCEDGESRSKRESDAMVVLDHGPLFLDKQLDGGGEGGFKFNHSSLEAEINWLTSSSPPKLKFLRDAEERLLSRLLREAENMRLKTQPPAPRET